MCTEETAFFGPRQARADDIQSRGRRVCQEDNRFLTRRKTRANIRALYPPALLCITRGLLAWQLRRKDIQPHSQQFLFRASVILFPPLIYENLLIWYICLLSSKFSKKFTFRNKIAFKFGEQQILYNIVYNCWSTFSERFIQTFPR